VFDLTSGYHQAPMSLNAIGFTAFICFCGLFEYLRVPFGLKGAPSYFQRVMSNVVLAGLVYSICEVYIDDIIVYATTAAGLLDNMRRVFDRIRKHKLLLHPKKARIGLQSVEYTGHVLDRTGISFSPEKIRTLLDFPLPQRKHQLKSFLGLANYFRDHIRDHSTITSSLQVHLGNYSKREQHSPLHLDTAAHTAFNLLKERIQNCPKLFFVDDHSPIHLYTDASTYGIGGYLVQMVHDPVKKTNEQPIAFMSASLQGGPLKWEIPQKEAYAIFAAIKKFEYLLRDRAFTIHTDHQNITYLNTSFLSQVRKWKIFISEFDYTFEYVKGEQNVVADALSRLVENHSEDIVEDTVLLAAFPSLPSKTRLPQHVFLAIKAVHNHNAGHSGAERTMARLKQYCDNRKIAQWPEMYQSVVTFIRQCACCQKMNMLKTPIAAHPFTASSYEPMERLNIDFIGPFPDGQYILVVIDCFTRWTELYLCPQATAEHTARKLLEHVGRYGAPLQLLSDRGSHFVNEVITKLLTLFGTEHCLNIAYSKEESAIVERQNREINRHLRNMFFHSGVINDYVQAIPLVMRIVNSSPHSRTRVEPYRLLFGNAVQLNRGIFLQQEARPDTDVPMSRFVSKLLSIQDQLLTVARTSLRKADEAHIASYSAARTEFPIGSYVLLTYPTEPPTRLHPRKRGPFEVIKFNNNDYTLRDLVSNKELTVHVTRLSPFEYDPLYTDPRLVANVDKEVFDVECILAHRGNLHRKSTLEFRVRWAGYDETSDTWEPWKHVRDNEQLHLYLRKKGLNNLIPIKFR
jgi:transposase InsO family protein